MHLKFTPEIYLNLYIMIFHNMMKYTYIRVDFDKEYDHLRTVYKILVVPTISNDISGIIYPGGTPKICQKT